MVSTKPLKYFHKYSLQGVCEGEGESGVSGGFHGLEGAAEAGEGADWVRGLDLQVAQSLKKNQSLFCDI